MEGYPILGSIYLLQENPTSERLVWLVVENNSNDGTSTLMVIEKCPEFGKKRKADAKKLCNIDPIGPIFPLTGEIVVENGVEFAKPIDEKVKSKVFKPTNPQN